MYHVYSFAHNPSGINIATYENGWLQFSRISAKDFNKLFSSIDEWFDYQKFFQIKILR